MYIPGLPYHVVQRGNNREACFFELENYQYYLELLGQMLRRYQAFLHAYVLMTNHVHLLITPTQPTTISNIMKVVGSRYVFYMNKTYQRSGTMWEGRHKSSVVDSEHYLLKCYRYIELNPVAAGMVTSPEEYNWSSYHANGWGDQLEILTPHDEYLGLGSTSLERCHAYRELFKIALSERDLHEIRKAAHYCQPLGDDRFRQQIEATLGVSLGQAKRGRPKKVEQGLVKK